MKFARSLIKRQLLQSLPGRRVIHTTGRHDEAISVLICIELLARLQVVRVRLSAQKALEEYFLVYVRS